MIGGVDNDDDGADGKINGGGDEEGGRDEDEGGNVSPLVRRAVAESCSSAQSNNRSLINHSLLFRPITCET